MKKILVTGSLGYIGSVLTKYLQEKGYDCVGYDMGFFRDCKIDNSVDTKTVFKDARQLEEKDLNGIDVLIHLAGISNDPFGNLDPASIYDPTREYSFRIAKLCKRLGIKFIFASSCSVYGIGSAELLDEDSPVNPQTPYSLNKLQIEQDLQTISDDNFAPIALRLATAFGMSPRMRFDIVINMFVGMALAAKEIILNSNGESWRPNVHILDVCKAFQYSVDFENKSGKLLILNVGDEVNNLRVIDLAKAVQKQADGCEIASLNGMSGLDKENLIRDQKIQDGVDTRTYKVSFKEIKRYFPNFECDWPVERGISDMVEKLKAANLTESLFKNINFYRLQKIDYLYKNGLISSDLKWI